MQSHPNRDSRIAKLSGVVKRQYPMVFVPTEVFGHSGNYKPQRLTHERICKTADRTAVGDLVGGGVGTGNLMPITAIDCVFSRIGHQWSRHLDANHPVKAGHRRGGEYSPFAAAVVHKGAGSQCPRN